MTATTSKESLDLENIHRADEIKSYVLRTDAIASCCVADIHSIPQALKDIEAYWLGTVPCRTVRIVGILISNTEYESRNLYSVDDGTGTVTCLMKRPIKPGNVDLAKGSVCHQSQEYDVGNTVSVVGKIEEYRGNRQIYVSSIQRCLLPNAESQHMLDVLHKHQTRYSQPFTIPPLPIPVPVTPQKHRRSDSQSNYASSMASTPTTTRSTPSIKSPQSGRARLRHPSRLRSKDLNENVFRIYVSNIMMSTLSLPESSPDELNSMSENVDNSTPKPSRTRSSAINLDDTPKRPARTRADIFGSPTPKKPTAQYQLPPVPPESAGSMFGVTLSYLRRVQVLADLARRVVDHAAHERDKALRHAEKSARAKYEALRTSPHKQYASRPGVVRSAAERSKVGPSLSRPACDRANLGPLQSPKLSHAKSSSGHLLVLQPHSISGSSRPSRSTLGSPHRAKIQRTEVLTPAEATRRAAYHAKQSKLHAEDAEKRPARTKRLFESALRTLVSEGEVVLYDGPKRSVPRTSKNAGKRTVATLGRGTWPDVTNTKVLSSGSGVAQVSRVLGETMYSDLDNISEDDKTNFELSDPSDSEDAYIPVTPQALRPALLAALRRSLMRHREGVDSDTWMQNLRGDELWARVPDLVIKEALELLREEEWISKAGGGRWDFTRGSWARSLTLS